MKLPFAWAWLGGMAGALLGSLGATADAGPPAVVVLRDADPDEVAAEAAARVQGELAASGFRVIVQPIVGDIETELQTAASSQVPVAAFAIRSRPSEDRSEPVSEIWVNDRIRQRTVIQRARLDEPDRNRRSEILAVRAVELLRASLAELWLPAPNHAPEPPRSESPHVEGRPVSVGRVPFGAGLGVGLGAAIDEGFGSVGATWAPCATVSYGWPRGYGLRATFTGFGPAVALSVGEGSARVDQEVATLEWVQAPWPKAPVVPFASIGAGVMHLHVAGVGLAPLQGHSADAWSPVTAVGLGAGVPLVAPWSMVVEGKGVLAWPPFAVHIVSSEAGRFGAPSLLLDAGLLGVFR